MTDRTDHPVVWQNVHKRRGDAQALADFSFALPRGHVTGLIGPNGAGKTTAIDLMLGLLRPDAGAVAVLGQPAMQLPWQLRQRVGFLPENSRRSQLPDLPLPDLLAWQSCYFDAWDHAWCDELIRRLDAPTSRRLWELSEGQRRRVEMVVALAHRPSLLVLDDPALGLDALARRELLWRTIDAVRDEGTTVLFTSHVLQDVERIVDDVCVLVGGRNRLHGSLEAVLPRCRRLVVAAAAAPERPLPGEVSRSHAGREVAIVTTEFTDGLVAQLPPGALLQTDPLGLEEIFCALAGDAGAPPTGTAR